ncbi:MAG: competence/damage-inducible protein A [Myxococcota bacterium]
MSLPRAEILTIGDELLSGETADTNSSYLDACLERWGYAVARHTTVPDDVEAIAAAFTELSARAELVISSGGLGPTDDDLTLEGLARALGVPLRLDDRTLGRIAARFQRMGRVMTPNNQRQARVPERGEILDNEVGSAPGFRAELGRAQIFLVPGVPREMRWFAEQAIGPRVDTKAPGLVRRTIKVIGLGESKLEHEIQEVVAAHPAVRFGYRTLSVENHVKLVAERLEDLERAAAAVRAKLGMLCFGEGSDQIESVLLRDLLERGATVASAESCTGGLIGKRLTDVPGSSAAYLGGVIAYANAVKVSMLGVEPAILEAHGSVSEPVARAMAEGVRSRLGARFGVATTGIAGPDGGSAEKPVGLVYIGLSGPGGTTVDRWVLPGDRELIRTSTAVLALDAVRRALRVSQA